MFARLFKTILLMVFVAVLLMTGCAAEDTEPAETDTDAPVELRTVRIGTLPTEDALPLWVAEAEGIFADLGLDEVEIITFQAAQERDAAFASGAIDAYMGDIIAAALMEAGGTPVTISTIMLGATPDEGRFGIVAAPESGYNDMAALSGVGVGTSTGTIQEYVVDGLMAAADIPAEEVVKEEVNKVPVRFDLLMNGQIAAAALPEPLLSLAVFQGATLLADDLEGENISQTVLVFSDDYLVDVGGIETLDAVLQAWDAGVAIINEDPDAWRDTLVEQARLPEPIKDTYRVNVYPLHQAPAQAEVDAVLAWMGDKGILSETVTYENLVLLMP